VKALHGNGEKDRKGETQFMDQIERIGRMDCKGVATMTRIDSGAVQEYPSCLVLHADHHGVISAPQPGLSAAAHMIGRRSKAGESSIRLLDIVGSLVILVVSLPVMVISALLIKLTSPGPVFYQQERVGQGGRLFTLCKFRTMINDAEKYIGPVWAKKDDDRVTPVGRVLRRMRIDELPQVYNVLRGDMSLVGPRPERPFFVEQHRALAWPSNPA
jgi:hypothetical protein